MGTEILKRKGNCFKLVIELLKKNNLDTDYIIKTSEVKLKHFDIVKNLPIFYREVFTFFNTCKKQNDIHKQNANSLMQQPIWNNLLIQVQGKTLFFPHWSKSGILYVKDLFRNDGSFKNLVDFDDILLDKKNWLCDYLMLKKAFNTINRIFNLSNTDYINIKKAIGFVFHIKYADIEDKKCNFFYKNLLMKKFKKPPYQNILSKEFSVYDIHIWSNIYKSNILDIMDISVVEFNYKLLNNLLNNNYFLSKWKNIDKTCKSCQNEIENTMHLIFQCDNVKQIWNLLSKVLNFEITWKHIVLGFYHEKNKKSYMLNNIISYTACKIYKCKMYCRIENKNETELCIKSYVKKHILLYYHISCYRKSALLKNKLKCLHELL